MDEPPPPDVPVDFGIAGLLHAWYGGDDQALNRLIPMVYDELRRLAGRHLRHERVGRTLHATDLVHEAFDRAPRSLLSLDTCGADRVRAQPVFQRGVRDRDDGAADGERDEHLVKHHARSVERRSRRVNVQHS